MNDTNHSLTLLSPAKLNLFLHITGRRDDGYHHLQTLFQLLDYGDTLHFCLNKERNIRLTPAIEGVAFEDNLIIKAAHLLQHHNQTQQGVDIHLQKILPMGGGIGGGSSNAATTLIALNHLWRCKLTLQQLKTLGLQLGADVPVFINAQTAWAEGIGEQLQAIELPQQWFLIVQPDCHVSTREIFLHKDLTRDTPAIKVATFLERGGKNDCQALVRLLYSPVNTALNLLEQLTPTARMTGTGACIFASFNTEKEAKQVQTQLPQDLKSFVAKGVNKSTLYALHPGI